MSHSEAQGYCGKLEFPIVMRQIEQTRRDVMDNIQMFLNAFFFMQPTKLSLEIAS